MVIALHYSPGLLRRWQRLFAVAILMIWNGTVWAQDWCGADRPAGAPQGGFTVSATRICRVPATITVQNTTSSPDNIFVYVYDYKGGDPIATRQGVAATTHTYDKPGKYKILQLGSINTGSVACQEIEVLDTRPLNYSINACSGRQVTVTITNDEISRLYDEFVINWGDGNTQRLPKTTFTVTHTYTSSAPRNVTVDGVYLNPAGLSFCQSQSPARLITPGATVPKPVISRLVTSASGGVSLQVGSVAAGQAYTIETRVAGGTYSPVQSFTGTGSVNLSTTLTAPACFRAVIRDNCGASTVSDEVCSLGLEVTAGNLENNVKWTSEGAGVQRYIVFRGNVQVTTVTAGLVTSYNDKQNLVCGTEYCYRVVASAYNGVTTIESETKCVKARSTEVPPPFRKVQVSVNTDGRVDLRALADPAVFNNPSYKMIVYRQDTPGGPFQPVSEEVSRNVHQAMGLNVNGQSYCFQVAYQNECGVNSTLSAPACTIWLKSDSPNSVDWTPESPFFGETVAQYKLEKLDESGSVVEEVDLQANTSYRPNLTDPDIQRFRFRVVAYSSENSISYSNYRTFTAQPVLFLPDAFTPNGDQINDAFVVKGSTFFQSLKMTIFSRWGEPLFATDKPEGWDGTINGQPAPAGTYVYRLEAVDQLGQTTVRRGTVILLR